MLPLHHIPRPEKACRACTKCFEPKALIVSMLEKTEEGYQRQDFCKACFKNHESCIFFNTVFKGKEAAEEPTDLPKKALDLLVSLASSKEKELLEEAYILALYLQRQKVLKERSRRGFFEHLETGDFFEIPDQNPLTISIPEVHKRLHAKLKSNPGDL